MINCSCVGERIRVEQRSDRPIGYLDHWALMTIADDEELCGKLVSAVNNSGGTIALSWLHLGEFVKVQDISHAKHAEDMLDQIFPNLFLLEVNPFSVQSNEEIILRGEGIVAPHSDSDFLAAFLAQDDCSLNPLSVRNLFSFLSSEKLRNDSIKMCKEIREKVNDLRSEYEKNKKFRNLVNSQGTTGEIERGTRYITREIMSLILKNRNRPFRPNDVMDLMHTIVPVSYCDFVLLDKHWENVANQAKSRLTAQGARFPLATVYSSKNNGIVNFIEGMERSI